MFFRRIKREKKEKKSSSDDDESEFIMETIAVAGFAANQWEKHKQKKINDKMANSLALQNTQNALGIQGAAEAFEGSRMLRQGRLGQDVANLGASAIIISLCCLFLSNIPSCIGIPCRLYFVKSGPVINHGIFASK